MLTLSSLPLITNVDILQENLDPALFPGLSSSIKAHKGFANEHAKLVPFDSTKL